MSKKHEVKLCISHKFKIMLMLICVTIREKVVHLE